LRRINKIANKQNRQQTKSPRSKETKVGKNRTGKTPSWAYTCGAVEKTPLPSKRKGKIETIQGFELWVDGKKAGCWAMRSDKLAGRKATMAVHNLPPDKYYRLIQNNRWSDGRIRSETIKSGFS